MRYNIKILSALSFVVIGLAFCIGFFLFYVNLFGVIINFLLNNNDIGLQYYK